MGQGFGRIWRGGDGTNSEGRKIIGEPGRVSAGRTCDTVLDRQPSRRSRNRAHLRVSGILWNDPSQRCVETGGRRASGEAESMIPTSAVRNTVNAARTQTETRAPSPVNGARVFHCLTKTAEPSPAVNGGPTPLRGKPRERG